MDAAETPLETTRFRVEDGGAGRRLDELLAERLVSLSRMHIAGLLARGACRVNGEAAHAGRRVGAGDLVEVESAGGVPNSMTPEPLPLEVVYEDGHLILVVKRGTLANALSYHLNRELSDESRAERNRTPFGAAFIRPGIVHRLDRDT